MLPHRSPPSFAKALAPLALVLGLFLVGAGCKQGIGDRCEQDSDCSSGMCTSMAVAPGGGTGRCVEIGTSITGSGGSTGAGGTTVGDGAAGSTGDAEVDGTTSEAGADAVSPGTDAAADAASTD
jgi:hypothetical protein